jgi:hypothetical protein
MFQEKLNELRPYVTGIRFVKDLPVVDVVLLKNWDMFESDTVTYKLSNTNENYFMVFPKDKGDSIDSVLNHVEYVIDFNVEKENKLTLLKAKIEELKVLFSDKSLTDLENLKFVIETIPEPTLNDIPITIPNKEGVVLKNGIELPPSNKNGVSKEKKEEV